MRVVAADTATNGRAGRASALNTVGWYHALLGEYDRTLVYCEQAISLHEEFGPGIVEATAWDSLGCAPAFPASEPSSGDNGKA